MSATTRLRSIALVLPMALGACGGSSATPREPSATASSTAPAGSLQAHCEAFFARARACGDPYIEGLVDLRIELDNPAGIAERARTEGREPLLATAKEEWAVDSQPENVATMCGEIVPTIPPEQADAMKAEGERCLAEATCEGFVPCAMVQNRQRLTAR